MGVKNRLKYWRHQKMMTQKEFAAFLGFNYSQYNRWERHEVQPSLDSLWQIKRKLDINIDDLLEWIPD